MVQPNRAPDWNRWRHIPTVSLAEGVALSLNIDPKKLHQPGGRALMAGKRFNEGPEFDNRLEQANRCLGVSLPGPINWRERYINDDKPIVKLRDFAVWAHSVEWDIPPELTALRSSAARRSHRPQIAGSGGRRGPKPELTEGIVSKMLAHLQERHRTVEQLNGDTLAALGAAYGGSPNTVSLARKRAVSEFLNSANSENSENPEH
jgi:hypothetical protein